MSAAKEKLAASKAALKEAKANHKACLKAAFGEGAKDLFVAHPELETFSWTQYTPYWCDGDQCTFGVNNDYPEINGDEVHDSRWDRTLKKSVPIEHKLGPANKAVKAFLDTFSTSDYEAMFGDHVKVTVNKDGVEVEEYEHD